MLTQTDTYIRTRKDKYKYTSDTNKKINYTIIIRLTLLDAKILQIKCITVYYFGHSPSSGDRKYLVGRRTRRKVFFT